MMDTSMVICSESEEILFSFLCNYISPQVALAFIAGSSMMGLGSERVKISRSAL
jgi:hypothetical protein